MELDAKGLRHRLDYDPQSGLFVWRVDCGKKIKAGTAAGSVNRKGYRRIQINGEEYLEHRLAWLWMTGTWPTDQIDHINRNKSDNRWINLREATNATNRQNLSVARRDNISGFLGVGIRPRGWRAQIYVDGKRIYLGLFNSPEEAHEVYLKAKREIHPGCTI